MGENVIVNRGEIPNQKEERTPFLQNFVIRMSQSVKESMSQSVSQSSLVESLAIADLSPITHSLTPRHNTEKTTEPLCVLLHIFSGSTIPI
jgi:hypothetical protein